MTSVAEAMAITAGLDESEPEVPQAETVSQDDIDSLLNDALSETQRTKLG
jgi:hypothetical protein